MPRGRSPGPSIKNPRQYEKMRSSGMSKSKAARIANAGKGALRKGGKQPSYDDWSKDDLLKRAPRPRHLGPFLDEQGPAGQGAALDSLTRRKRGRAP